MTKTVTSHDTGEVQRTGMLMTREAADIRASRLFDATRAQGAAQEASC
jgi:hypothetical protein